MGIKIAVVQHPKSFEDTYTKVHVDFRVDFGFTNDPCLDFVAMMCQFGLTS